MTEQQYGRNYSNDDAENYERFFVPNIGTPVMKTLLEYTSPAAGERVLDTACGTGLLARVAAERVGDKGYVAGLDITGGMLDVARKQPGTRGIDWYEADVESMPLDDASFDLVYNQMGMQFVSNKLAAMREIRRVLAPGGRLALNVPGPTPDLFARLAPALGKYVGPEAAGFCHIVFSLHDAGELRELASGAGFREIDVRQQTLTLDVPDAASFLWGYIYCTPMAAHFVGDRIDDSTRAALERDVVEAWKPFAHGDGMRFEVGITTLLCK